MEVGGDERFKLELDIYLGNSKNAEISVDKLVDAIVANNIQTVGFTGDADDAFDEIRHMDRELYESEIIEFGNYLKNSRTIGKSQGSIGSIGW